jgi:putative inorganic carbon (HCO3(-)) transporter
MPFYLLLLFILMLFANPALLVPSLEVVRPAQLTGISAMAILLMQKTVSRDGIRLVWPESPLMLALISAMAVSCVGAFWPHLAFEATLDFLKIVVIYFLILNCVESERRLWITTATLIAAGTIPALGTLRNYVEGNFVEGARAAWIGTFANPNDMAYSLVLLMPLALYLGGRVRLAIRPLVWLVIAIYIAAIFATHSRGALLGLFAVLIIFGLRQRGATSRLLVLCALAAGFVFTTFFWTRDAGFNNLGNDFTVHQRLETIRSGLRMFADHPLFGVGIACSIVAWPLYASANLDFQGALVTHNTIVEALGETGIVGFACFIALIAAAIFHARKLQTDDDSDHLAGYGAAFEGSLVGYLVCGISGGYMVSWFPYIIIGLISAAILISKGSSESYAIHS